MAYTKDRRMVRMSITSEEVRKVEHSIKSEEWGRNDTRGIVVNQIKKEC